LRRPKILMVIHCFLPESVGGSEFYTFHLSKELMRRGIEVTIFTAVYDMNMERYNTITTEFEGIKVIKVMNSSYFETSFADSFIDINIDKIFKEVVQLEKPDIIHFQHTAYLSSRLPEIAKQLLIPSLFTLHDYWYMCHKSHLLRFSEGICPGPSEGIYCASCYSWEHPEEVPGNPLRDKELYTKLLMLIDMKERLLSELKEESKPLLHRRKVDYSSYVVPTFRTIQELTYRMRFMRWQLSFPAFTISPSLYLKKRYEREGFREILHVPHGFEPADTVDQLPYDGKIVLAYLSNIVSFKGADVILKELKLIYKRQNLKIFFYGKVLDEIYQKELERLAKGYPDVDISFMGAYSGKDDLEKILANVHFVVFPSLWEENHPLVIGEALQYGIPVITSQLGGAPEKIINGINGFIFNPYKEGDFAKVINKIQNNPDLIYQVKKGASETKIETIAEHVDKIESLYLNIFKK